MSFDGDNIVIRKSLDVEPLLDAIGPYSELADSQRHRTGRHYRGSVDLLTAQNWAKECGSPIGTKEFSSYAKKQLAKPEFSKFKAPFQKKLF